MSNDTQETINQEQQQPKKSYNPFISPVNEKPYSQMNVNVEQQRMYAPIPEASLNSNTIDGNENAYGMLNGEMAGMGGASLGGSNQSFNPSMNNLSDKDTKESAEHLAKAIVDGYEQLHVLGNNWLQISQKELNNLVAEGLVNLNVEIPYEYGKFIPAGELIKEVNEQNKDVLSVSKEFRKEVIPLLTKILAKRGVGMTDEQKLMFIVGKDLVLKGIVIYQVKSATKQLIEVIKEYTNALRDNGGVVKHPPRSNTENPPSEPNPEQPRPTKPPREPRERAGDRVYEESFNFDTNEVVVESAVVRHHVPESGKSRLMAQKKRDKEIEEAMKRAENLQNPTGVSYAEAIQSKKTGKRGRKPKDYVKSINEAEIAEAIVLSETKNSDIEPSESID